jgi:hypothetical protein
VGLITTRDADGISCNLSYLEEGLKCARWYDTLDQDAVPRWHASLHLAWMEEKFVQIIGGNLMDDVDVDSIEKGTQVTTDVWKD